MQRPSSRPRFHLAFPVRDLPATRRFYAETLGCALGRESARWIDFDFFGHQISAHLVDGEGELDPVNAVDGDAVPVRHFGLVLEWSDWEALVERLRRAGVPFVIGPRVRFAGKPGEQGTVFIRDPSGNALEFKALRDMGRLFAPQEPDEHD